MSATILAPPETEPSGPPDPLGPAFEPITAPRRPFPSTRRRRRFRIGPLGLLALLAFAGYVAYGLHLRFDLGFTMVDAFARNVNARYLLFGRDPHLGALSFYWMPMPTVMQLPYVLLLEPFGLAELSGPLSTATYSAGTVYVLGRICRLLGVGQPWVLLIPLAFGINPVVVLYAANGMSEACLLFFVSLSLLGLLRFNKARTQRNATFLAFALSGLLLSRYEAILAVGVIAAGALLLDAKSRRRHQFENTAALLLLPPAYAAVVWFAAQWIIVGSPFYFARVGAQTSRGTAATTALLPTAGNGPEILEYGLYWTFSFGPLLLLLFPFLLLFRRSRLIVPATIAAAAATFPLVTMYLLNKGGTFGDPRYFLSASVFAAVVACLLASLRLPFPFRPLWRTGIVALLALSAVPASIAMSRPSATFTTGDWLVLAPIVGRDTPDPAGCPTRGPGNNCDTHWRQLAQAIDDEVDEGELVLVDTRFNWHAALYSDQPERIIVNSDRDFRALLTEPEGAFEYVIVRGGGGLDGNDFGNQLVQGSPPGTWTEVLATETATLFRLADPDADLPSVVPPS